MKGVTLIGDAAHLMPPAGEGANLAMYDGAMLGQAIANHPNDINQAIASYEKTCFHEVKGCSTCRPILRYLIRREHTISISGNLN